jgi:putative FmdB family regulatory protein
MPIYEYRCESCGKELEKIQKFSDPPLTECPACGKPALIKLVSASSFRLKGSGWYETDFKDKKKSTEGNKNDDSGKSGKDGVKDKTTSGGTTESGKGKAGTSTTD